MFLFLCTMQQWAYAEQQWRQEIDQEGIRIDTRAVGDSDIREFRAQVRVDAPVAAVLALLDDVPSFADWIEGCSDARLIGQHHFLHRLTYQVNDMPWFVSDRDLVMEVSVQELESGHFLLLLSNRPDAFPDQGLVRVNRASGYYLLKPEAEGGTWLTWEQHMEPGGELPAWLVNQLLVDIPFNSLKKLREILEDSASPFRQARLERDEHGRVTGWAPQWLSLRSVP